jgi:hypothetical protein
LYSPIAGDKKIILVLPLMEQKQLAGRTGRAPFGAHRIHPFSLHLFEESLLQVVYNWSLLSFKTYSVLLSSSRAAALEVLAAKE